MHKGSLGFIFAYNFSRENVNKQVMSACSVTINLRYIDKTVL